MGWFVVPKLGETCSWAMYDFPERRCTEQCDMEVLGRAEVHGIQGVEIRAVEYAPSDCSRIGDADKTERRFVAQLTETHCRILAESHVEDGVRKLYTFLDGGDFLDNWGFGEDNCGNAVRIAPRGDIRREGSAVTAAVALALAGGESNVNIMARVAAPVDFTTLAELSFCDNGVTYFDFAEALSELVNTGHLTLSDDRYAITDKGRRNGSVCEDNLPFSVRQRCDRGLSRINAVLRRDAQVRTELLPRTDGSVTLRMILDDEKGNLMTLDVLTVSEEQGARLAERFRAQPEKLYLNILQVLLEEEEE